MTWLFPVGCLLSGFSVSKRNTFIKDNSKSDLSRRPSLKSIAILIPAHNEAAVLSRTLESILAAVAEAKNKLNANCRICIGADGCSDDTALVARSCGVEVLESKVRCGKWQTLCELANHCKESDWLILADSGVYWSEDFLCKLLPYCEQRNVIGIAPTYVNPDGGTFEKVLWWIERQLKSLEALSGGPVSVHGATVCYRGVEFISTLTKLPSSNWLNDDVVLPLSMRGNFPDSKILYLPELEVREISRPPVSQVNFKRRRRMVLGNIEWIKQLWVPLCKQNPVAALLATRRIFRLLWAYWLILSAATVTSLVSLYAAPYVAVAALLMLSAVMLLLLASKPGRYLSQSAFVSLLAPYYFISGIIKSARSGVSSRSGNSSQSGSAIQWS